MDAIPARAVPGAPAAAAGEMDSSVAQPLPAAQLAPPGPALATFPAPVPNYQDLTDESPSDDDEQDWDALVSAVERNFSEQQIDDMHAFLKERGLFAFLKEYLEKRGVPPSTLLLAFGVMIVRTGRLRAPSLCQMAQSLTACVMSSRAASRPALDRPATDAQDCLFAGVRSLFLFCLPVTSAYISCV